MTKCSINTHPEGSLKKNMASPMAAKYDPTAVERHWDLWWESMGFYKAAKKSPSHGDERFVMVIPPPNVTGRLHIGHALMCAIQDCLVRWHRMCGHETLWVPGIDHAGIATQTVVEMQLKKSRGLSRFDLGRDEFVQLVWEWKRKYGSKICDQIRRLGASVDWNRSFFTMSEKLEKAVKIAFVRLYRENKIYRAKRFVNWSCNLTTAIADCEVKKVDVPNRTLFDVPGHNKKVEFGVIHKFSYKLADSETGEEIQIETTRPETILGDVAVAVHPKDARYSRLVGRLVQHPFLDKKLPIIADAVLVDMEKGTGVVKVTPAHDENDYNCGQRNGLESICIFDDDGRINDNGGAYRGMMRFDCRYAIIQDLVKRGQYFGKRDFQQVVNLCSRSNDIIEPLNTSQWWVNCEDMARRSCEVVRSGELEIIPKKAEKIFFGFLQNIRPWCISRQLWWGHRIPAYIPIVRGERMDPDKAENWIVAESREEAMEEASKRHGDGLESIEQDEDVLDTWFSSSLLPFSVFGWPDSSEELERYYPGSLLETGSDILFFWVARMMFMSLQLNNTLPFKKILLHPMVRAADGSKMSKSKGNIVDPLEVIEGAKLEDLIKKLEDSNLSEKQIKTYTKLKSREFPKGIPECGADALRIALLCHLNQGNSINLDISRVNGYRLFCNKIWQTANYVFPKLKILDADTAKTIGDLTSLKGSRNFDAFARESFSLADKWILTRLNRTVAGVNDSFKTLDLSRAAFAAYDFWLKDFCDIYLELTKPVFNSSDSCDQERRASIVSAKVLLFVMGEALKLFHPFMPFLTEELYQRMPGREEEDSIMVESYPTAVEALAFETVENEMALAMDVVRVIRSSRNVYELGNDKIQKVFVTCGKDFEVIGRLKAIISVLAKVEEIEVLRPEDVDLRNIALKCSHDVVNANMVVNIELKGMPNIKLKLEKISRRKDALEKSLKTLRAKLGDSKRQQKVPEALIEAERAKENEQTAELKKLEDCYQNLSRMKSDD